MKEGISNNQKEEELYSLIPKWDDVEFPGSVMSEEESRRRHEELIQGKITPELLKFFNNLEAYDLVKYFYSTPSQPTSDLYHAYDLHAISREAKEFLAEEIKDKRMIELGNSGWNKMDQDTYGRCNVPTAEFLSLGARSCEGCDPKYNTDGLTFLLRQPDESAIVTSFGVLEDGVLYMEGCEINNLLSRYTTELGRQIYRVTPKGAITLHGLDWCGDLENAGFVIEEPVTEYLKRGRLSGELVVLRKK